MKDITYARPEPLALSIPAAAIALGGVSEELIRLEITRGNLKPSRVGRRIVIQRREIERYLAANQVG